MNVHIVYFASRMLGTVFHGVYDSEIKAKQEANRMEEEREGIEYWTEAMPMNSNVEE